MPIEFIGFEHVPNFVFLQMSALCGQAGSLSDSFMIGKPPSLLHSASGGSGSGVRIH
jgi:hypothetical protein